MASNLPTQLLMHKVLCGAMLASVVAFLPGAAIAQTPTSSTNSSSVNPLQDFKTRDSHDPFSNSSGGVAPGFFDLIHRATQGFEAGTSAEEQGQALDAATLEFRNQQKQRLDPSTAPAVAPQATTPASPTQTAQ